MSNSQASLEFLRILKAEGLDKALSIAGDYNRYQWKLLIFFGIQWLITSFVLMIQPFLTQVPTFYCSDATNPSDIYECSEDASCSQAQGVMLGSNPPNNIVTEFGLYCDKASLRNLGGTIFFFGGGLGTLIFSYVADQYGRRKALLIAYVVGSISILIMGLAGTVLSVFYVFLGVSWLGYDAYFVFSMIVASEAGGTKLRGISNAVLLIIWGIGLCAFIGLAYLIQDWRQEVLYTIAIPACICISFFVQIYESPRFLYAKKRYEECSEVLAKIAKENNRDPSTASLLLTGDARALEVNASQPDVYGDDESKSSQTSYLLIITNPWLRKRFIIFTILILYLYLSYNGILFALADIGGNIYENSIVVSAAELLSYISSLFILKNVRRKRSFLCIMLAAATGGIIFALIPYIECEDHFACSQEFLQDLMSLIIKYSVCLSFGLIYVYGAELFPTTTRSKCIGLAASIGRASGMFITWLNNGLTDLGINPILFYGCLGLVILILLKWLPETYGCKLMDYIPETNDRAEKESNEEIKLQAKKNKVKNEQAEEVY